MYPIKAIIYSLFNFILLGNTSPQALSTIDEVWFLVPLLSIFFSFASWFLSKIMEYLLPKTKEAVFIPALASFQGF